MLKRVVSKAYNALTVYDSTGMSHGVKINKYEAGSERALRADREILVDADTQLVEGDVLDLEYCQYILSRKDPEYFRGRIIRYVFDAILATHKFNVIRTTLTKTDQGGLKGKSDAVVLRGVFGKITVKSNVQDEKLETYKTQYVLLVSAKAAIQVGDRLSTTESSMQAVRVESVARREPGLNEILLDQDPRWI